MFLKLLFILFLIYIIFVIVFSSGNGFSVGGANVDCSVSGNCYNVSGSTEKNIYDGIYIKSSKESPSNPGMYIYYKDGSEKESTLYYEYNKWVIQQPSKTTSNVLRIYSNKNCTQLNECNWHEWIRHTGPCYKQICRN